MLFQLLSVAYIRIIFTMANSPQALATIRHFLGGQVVIIMIFNTNRDCRILFHK